MTFISSVYEKNKRRFFKVKKSLLVPFDMVYWKIKKTIGTKITKVTPLEGVSAETAGAITLFMTEQMGIPVSTTHTITGSIIGVGATKRLSAVRWGVTRSLLVAWIITIPVSALVAGLTYLILGWMGIS